MMEKQRPIPLEASVDPSVDEDEVAKFAALADEWWDPDGKFRPLHMLNPTRLEFIRDAVCRRFERDPLASAPLAGLRVLDIGCGGGLLTEPMARLGADVVGIDAAEESVRCAADHAARMGLTIDYRFLTAEALARAGERFDVVLNMEVVEHVADAGAFLEVSGELVRPGGITVLATLNRTMKAFALAIVGAEYVLRWLPRGTHDWRKFQRPSELAAGLRRGGVAIEEFMGLVYDPLKDRWRLAPRDIDVNYMAVGLKPG